MKKTLVLLLAAAVAYMSADAAKVSADYAKTIASGVLPGRSLVEYSRSRAGMEGEPYYVFNAEDGRGFVIVAADDRLPGVLGYADRGTIDLSAAPEGLMALLGMSSELLTRLDETGESRANRASTGKPVVGPLLGDINWGQGAPFNTMCPKLDNGTTGYVGCVATAMAQIMRFYGYPMQGEGSHSYTDNGRKLTANFGETVYDWGNMPAAVPDTPTGQQVAAYSTLCAHLGVAVDMQYAAGGSGAYTMVVPRALREHFGYSPAVAMHSRSYYNSKEWMSMITAELDKGRPLYYAASSEDGLGGHAFVCDGYDTEGYVHINWGWYGSSNGYFAINHLNPGELGTGGGGGAYNLSQEILTDFVPRGNGDRSRHIVYGATRLSVNSFGTDMTFMSTIENLDTKVFEGKLSAVLTDTDDNIVCQLKEEPMTIQGFANGRSGVYWATMRGIPTTCQVAVPDGKYRLHYGYAAEGAGAEVVRHPVGLPGYADCHVSGNVIVVDGREEIKPNVRVEELHTDGEVYVNGSARFLARVNNLSDNFRLSNIVLRLTGVEDPTLELETKTTVNIYDLCEADVVVDVDLPETLVEGNYRVTMFHEGYEDSPFAVDETVVTLLAERTVPVLRLIGDVVLDNSSGGNDVAVNRDGIVMLTMPLKNYGAPGTMITMARLQPVDRRDAETVVLAASSQEWAKGETRSQVFGGVVRVDPGRYAVSFHTLDAQGKETPMDGYVPEITVEESDNTSVEVVSLEMPQALKQGERVQCSITLKSDRGYEGYVYVRVRQFTYTNGEIATMQNVKLQPGETVVKNFRYAPSASLADGRYLVMVETRSGNSYNTAGGHANYYRELYIGDNPDDTGGVDSVLTDGSVTPCDAPVVWYDLHGRVIAESSRSGLYLRRIGEKVEKVVIR